MPRFKLNTLLQMVIVTGVALGLMGCAVHMHQGRPSDKKQISRLSGEVGTLESELSRLQQLRERDRQQLEKSKSLLSKLLEKEIDDKQVKVEQSERGVVITFLAEVLFDSGKADVREDAHQILEKVAKVLNQEVAGNEIGIEGHTDNEPIKRSGWKSNWELSTARATSVLHYLVDDHKVAPTRVSAIGYGEYRPIISNDTKSGRQKNRRVEVVILPKDMSKIRADLDRLQREASGSRDESVEQYIK